MYRILQTGRTGLEALQRKMDVISNNIANVQTNGYKNMEVQFEDLVYDRIANRGVPLSDAARGKPIELGTGSRVKSTARNFKQGPMAETGYPFHMAIEGEGFFGVQDENGNLFLTRDGGFTLDAEGQLVDARGNRVVMELYSPLAQWKDNGISIDARGVFTGINEEGQIVEIGRLRLYNVPDKSLLTSIGSNYFSAENVDLVDNTEIYEGWGQIRQGFLEESSVDIGKEMVDMLVTQRAYQINTKSIHAADEMWSMVNQMKR